MSEQVKQEGEFKVKKKPGRPKKLVEKQNTVKVDLQEEKKDAVQEPETTKVELQSDEQSKETKEETKVELQDLEQARAEQEPTKEVEAVEESTIEEIVETTSAMPEIKKEIKPQAQVPENLQDLVKFMNETGGSMEDYINLNKDYSSLNDSQVLREYYKKTKPHLNQEEIEFILEDSFSWNEEEEDARTVKKKQLAYKEEIAKAKSELEKSKQEYYKEIKLKTNNNAPNEEYEAALDFVNTYRESQDRQTKMHGTFKDKTHNFFKNEFNGFKFDVGEKKFNYKLNDPSQTADQQTNLQSVFKKFLNDDGSVKDYAGYHKAIYAASNSDNLVSHFYEQGRADATKDIMAKSKNIQDGKPRATASGDVYINGLKVKAITGADSSKLKFKKRT
jgi:hypothetical protein